MSPVTFQQETAQGNFAEVKPLLEAHWDEVAMWPDQILNPDWDLYRMVEDAGMVRAYTVRDAGVLVGYALFFVRPNIHATHVLMAVQDVLYVMPEYRGKWGARFLLWIEAQLRQEGVGMICQGTSPRHDLGALFARLGYVQFSTTWAKTLAGGHR